jgi:hypothetical protein
MTAPPDITAPFSRVTWRDGQALLARDLAADLANTQRLRRLHLRYQHGVWGIVQGFRVTPAGNSLVFITAGYAIDQSGGELLLPRGAQIPTPASATARTTMYLVATRPADADPCAPPRDISALCIGRHAAQNLAEAALAWKTVAQVRLGTDILLARALIQNGRLASPLDPSVRRRAASQARPKTWSDRTQPGATGWQDSTPPTTAPTTPTIPGVTIKAATQSQAAPREDVIAPPREIFATIDTSAAGFLTPPAYFARLAGGDPHATGCITAAGPEKFIFTVRLDPRGTQSAAAAEQAGWTIDTFAIETIASANPRSAA